MDDTKKLIELRQASLAALKAMNGTYWQDVAGELHLHYGELPTWILVYTNSDVLQSHRALCTALKPFMEKAAPLQFTVSYLMITPEFQITIEALMDNDDILDAVDRPSFGTMPTTNHRRENGMFNNATSTEKPIVLR